MANWPILVYTWHMKTTKVINRQPRRPIPARRLLALYVSAGGVCAICGNAVDPTDASVDHIIPVARGGASEVANYQLTHQRCNQQKSAGDREWHGDVQDKRFIDLLLAHQRANGLTDTEMSRRLGIAQPHWSLLSRGKRGVTVLILRNARAAIPEVTDAFVLSFLSPKSAS